MLKKLFEFLEEIVFNHLNKSSSITVDPEAELQLQLKILEDDLNKVTKEVGESERYLFKERAELEELCSTYNRWLEAAERANKLIAEQPNDQQLPRSLDTLLSDLENLKLEIQLQEQCVVNTESMHNELKEIMFITGERVRKDKTKLVSAKRNLVRAERRKEHAERIAQIAENLAGLSSVPDGVLQIVESLKQRTEKLEIETYSNNLKVELLTPVGEQLANRFCLTTSTENLTERLDRLRVKPSSLLLEG
jgi:hypothetical protein